MHLLENFRLKSQVTEEMFKTGALESFSRCAKMAYTLGLIPEPAFKNLEVIGSIRNKFAHHPNLIDFDHPEIIKFCIKLTLPNLPDKIKSRAVNWHHKQKFGAICGYLFLHIMNLASSVERCQERSGRFNW
jgi:DNA-binding MltR family transcriptional regulator